ncbi:leucyl/phenylalanyl-tRNA--protein transferase [Halomonas sp. V046]|uniref:leucyl/phenylalanyl-tRNA--protein transferase n=1 Tax=Halomonas sp. V046 TaxID=3459611 RepID=UPI004044DFDF
MLPWLAESPVQFPPVTDALDDPDGLLAAGGGLTPAWLVSAYRRGIFPWYNDDQPILWWSPGTRMVLPPEEIRVRRSLAKRLRNGGFTVSADRAFDRVIEACAAPRDTQADTWITAEMCAAYRELHRHGIAHSVEVWHQGALVGGLYGVALGPLFFGESMFSVAPDASKVALVHLARAMAAGRGRLIDCQMHTPHLESLGARGIARREFIDYLDTHLTGHDDAAPMTPTWSFDTLGDESQ